MLIPGSLLRGNQVRVKMCILCVITCLITNAGYTQQPIDHWEAIVLNDDMWRFHPGTGDPPENWKEISFADDFWQLGQGGIGYGDSDDNTIISSTISLYMRKEFDITDCAEIGALSLFADYDDAFVAYLNGVEIARSNIGQIGVPPEYNQPADGNHEAELYRGGEADQFNLDQESIHDFVCDGANVLAIQVHNVGINSSDLSSNFFLIGGIVNTSNDYRPVPEWFREPFTTSNLPILIIQTSGQNIPDEPKINAHMGIIDYAGSILNSVYQPFNGYDGKIAIEIKGSSSQSFPKKNFLFETRNPDDSNNNVELLGMPEENDWVLHGPYSDKSLLRNVLGYYIGTQTGRYAPRTRFCELIINDSYQGLYVLTEQLKRDKNRVDIAKVTPDDIEGDELTGGYLISVDRNEGEESGWSSPFTNSVFYRYKDPGRDELLEVQKNYIKTYVTNFERDVLNNPTIETIENYVDVGSWIDYWIATEICKHIDGFKFSFYMYKKKDSNGGKLHFGPLWDLNLAFGNFDFGEDPRPAGWSYEWANNGFLWPRWVIDLSENEAIQNRIKCRWEELRNTTLETDVLLDYLRNQADFISSARQRNFHRWNILNSYVWPNYYVGETYADEFAYLENWLINRLNWMDQNMFGQCNLTSTKTFDVERKFQVIPNPSSGSFTLIGLLPYDDIKEVVIRSLNGEVIKKIESPQIQRDFTINPEWSGVFIISVLTRENWYNQKVMFMKE